MYRGALGIIETVGQVGSVEAADAMTKCAEVELLGREDIGGGYHSVLIRGDVGSVRAALEAGVHAAEQVGRLVGVLLIPRPHDELGDILPGPSYRSALPSPRAPSGRPSVGELETMNVHQLRALARELPEFPMRGREISRANREKLLVPLRDLLAPPPTDADDGGDN